MATITKSDKKCDQDSALPFALRVVSNNKLPPFLARFFLPKSALIDVSVERVSIWLSSPCGAPSQKCIRVDYDPEDKTVVPLPNALVILGLLAPAFKVPGYVMRVEHDLLHASVSLWIEPRDADAVDNVGADYKPARALSTA